ncbi:histidine phosphatase family protein [Fundidesulfovibrio soli]|uniref:histidine phosphatase family protein n=1 Tax=Fundidesulfovibrio soli TaxID=2922716 RepID=UPI001FAEBA47|nr:histidine phosphatase family protein [Fundidesulfovibrio soli]
MSLTVYLLRHGRTAREDPWRFLGQRDAPLSDAGRDQMRWWRKELASLDFAGAWCSDLTRCRESAELVLAGHGLTAIPMAGLREISLGEWDGLSVEEVRRSYPGLYEARGADIAGFRPPGGESFADLAQRAGQALKDILRQATGRPVRSLENTHEALPGADNANILLVAHAGVNRVLICDLLGFPLEGLFSLGQDHGCLNVLRFGNGKPVLHALNHEVRNEFAVTSLGIQPE